MKNASADKLTTDAQQPPRVHVKATFSFCDAQWCTHKLTDVSADPAWHDVKAVERITGPLGTLRSVVNHRDKTFEQRKAEMTAASEERNL